eukprot:8496615-Pyramimonas_sp.AAC.1
MASEREPADREFTDKLAQVWLYHIDQACQQRRESASSNRRGRWLPRILGASINSDPGGCGT